MIAAVGLNLTDFKPGGTVRSRAFQEFADLAARHFADKAKTMGPRKLELNVARQRVAMGSFPG